MDYYLGTSDGTIRFIDPDWEKINNGTTPQEEIDWIFDWLQDTCGLTDLTKPETISVQEQADRLVAFYHDVNNLRELDSATNSYRFKDCHVDVKLDDQGAILISSS